MTRHRFSCPLRWADMDQLAHVNNVTYVDYLQEAWVDLLRTHLPREHTRAGGVVVARHAVQYLQPLVFRVAPVTVETWVTEVRAATFTLAYEIFDEAPEGRRVYVRARSVLAPYAAAARQPRRISDSEREVLTRFLEPAPTSLAPRLDASPAPPKGRHPYPGVVRFSDLDVHGHVNNVKHFEYYQEARIALIGSLGGLGGEDADSLGVVVAQADVDYREPMLPRPEPYAVETWVARVGRSSFVVDGHIRDGDTVLSRSSVVMVAFDAATQRSRELSAPERRALAPRT